MLIIRFIYIRLHSDIHHNKSLSLTWLPFPHNGRVRANIGIHVRSGIHHSMKRGVVKGRKMDTVWGAVWSMKMKWIERGREQIQCSDYNALNTRHWTIHLKRHIALLSFSMKHPRFYHSNHRTISYSFVCMCVYFIFVGVFYTILSM